MNHVENILSVYRRATGADKRAGMAWYGEAFKIAVELSPSDPWIAAGVLAALSPREKWDQNVIHARRAFETGVVKGNTFTMNAIGQRILDGEPALSALKGDKTRAFAASIATAGHSDMATIDRHALEIAYGQVYSDKERPSIGKRVYRELAAAYSEAAAHAGVSVNEIQAITWVVWRREKGIK